MMPVMAAEEVRVAQVLTGFVMAAFLLIGTVPALRGYASRLRVALLVGYLVGAVAFVGYVMVR
jgi:hypothetical protein